MTTSATNRARRAEARTWAGYLSARISRQTGTLVAVLRSAEAGIESDPDLPYTTLCDDHSTLVCHRTRSAAEGFAAEPAVWCEPCRRQLEDPTP